MMLSGEISLGRTISRPSESPACETALWLANVATTFQPILAQPEWQFKPTSTKRNFYKYLIVSDIELDTAKILIKISLPVTSR